MHAVDRGQYDELQVRPALDTANARVIELQHWHLLTGQNGEWMAVPLIRARVGGGGLHMLLNNAGVATSNHPVDPVRSADLEEMLWVFRVNVAGTLRVIQAMLPLLEAHTSAGGGHAKCVNVSSDLGSLANNCAGNEIGACCAPQHAHTHAPTAVRPRVNPAHSCPRPCPPTRGEPCAACVLTSRAGHCAAPIPAPAVGTPSRLHAPPARPPRRLRPLACTRRAGQAPGGKTSYRCSKAALNMLTRTLASDVPGVSFAAVSPGWVATDMGSKGGSAPPLTVAQSCSALLDIAQRLTRADSGAFLSVTNGRVGF